MNSKKGLSRIMSALLAAMSMVGGASADTKKKTKEPNGAAAVLRDRKNRGRDKRGNGRGNKRGEKLGLSSAGSRVVGWIKENPKTSAGLGLVGLGAISCGVYKIYNSEWRRYYRDVFNEENYARYYMSERYLPCREKQACVGVNFSLEGMLFSDFYVTFLCKFDGSEKSLLRAHAKTLFFSNCVDDILKYLVDCSKDASKVRSWDGKEFESFEDIGKQFCDLFPDYSQKIKEIVKFYIDFTDKYLEELADKVLEYGKEENKKMVVGEGGKVECVARGT